MINTRIIRIDPRQLKLLDLNAHYMRQEVFGRLVANLQRDGTLTGQTPFAWRLHDDTTGQPLPEASGQPVYEVISGNHRVKAAIAAGLPEIDLCITDDYLPPDRRRAIQLSHNSIFGEDDPATLKIIYESISDTDLRLYSGLDDKSLRLLTDVTVSPLSEAALEFQPMTLMFLPHEVEQVQAAFEAARREVKAHGFWAVSMRDYDQAMDALEIAGQSHNIKNTATALMLILEVFSRHLTELTAGYLDEAGEPLIKRQRVPIATLTGSTTLPAPLAARLRRALTRLNPDNPLAALEALANLALAAPQD